MDEIDKLAQAMRLALGRYQNNAGLVPWNKANSVAKDEWRECAKAAKAYLENPPKA